MVANGDRVKSRGLCRNIILNFGTYSFPIDLYVLDLSGFVVVLGVNWPKTLRPVLWDFKEMQIAFFAHGKRRVLQGIQNACTTKIFISHSMEVDKHDEDEFQ